MQERVEQLLLDAVNKNILPLTGRCNLSCVFCSHRYNLPGVEVYDLPPLSREKIETLIAGLNPDSKIVIGESVTRLREGEPFLHPEILTFLDIIRKRFPETPLQVTTNGSLLTEEILRQLKKLQPLELVFSLNSISLKGRGLLMGDPDPSAICEIIGKTSAMEIPFHGSVVAMPQLVGWADLKDTLSFLEENGALTIRIFLPGFTSLTPDYLKTSSSETIDLNDFIAYMQETLTCPLLQEPPRIVDTEPLIEGVIHKTPAAVAGLQRNDIIISVNGKKPHCRVEAFNMVREAEDPLLSVMRTGGCHEKKVIKKENSSSGIAMHFDIDPRHINKLKTYSERSGEILLMTSISAGEIWEKVAASLSLQNVKIVPVPSVFWGGSISCAGLLTVYDFKSGIRNLPGGYNPATVLLPPLAFDSRGLDMKNTSYLELSEMFSEKTKIIID